MIKKILFYYNYCFGYFNYYNKNFYNAQKYFLKALYYDENHAICNCKLGMSYFKMSNWIYANKYLNIGVKLKPNTSWRLQLIQSKNHMLKNNTNNSGLDITKISLNKKQSKDLLCEVLGFYKDNKYFLAIDKIKQILKIEFNLKLAFILVELLFKIKRFKECSELLNELLLKSKINDSFYFYLLGYCYSNKGVDGNEINLVLSNSNYFKAIELDKELQSKKYGIGVFHLKIEETEKAAIAFEEYTNELKHTDEDLCFNTAETFFALNNYTKAVKYYIKTLKLNYQRSNTLFKLALCLEIQKKYKFAHFYYLEAINRNNVLNKYWHYRLMLVAEKINLKTLNYLNDLYPCFSIKKNKDDTYDKNKKIINLYTYYYENTLVEDNLILYESYHGINMSCSPYAVFLSLLSDERFKNYRHIWVYKDDHSNIKQIYKKRKDIILVKKGSELYVRYLAQAKYLFNNSTFPEYFTRKKEQIYINTWHGTPIKLMGRKIKQDKYSYSNVQRNFLQSTHLVMPNSYSTDIFLRDYYLSNIYKGKICEIGYPRIDLTINSNKDEIYEILRLNKSKRTILYSPTFRGDFKVENNKINNYEEDLLLSLSSLENFNILYRGHYTKENLQTIKNVIVPDTKIDTNELLSIVDLLITDYSSIAFDFMVTKKPILYYVYDLDDYLNQRGLYFNIKHIGKNIFKNKEELLSSIIFSTYSNNISENVYKKFAKLNNGKSTKAIIDIVFNNVNNANVYEIKHKKNILFYAGGLLANGITSSFVNLIKAIKKDNIYNVVTICENINTSDKEYNFDLINKESDIILKKGQLNVYPQETISYDANSRENNVNIIKREILRQFGDCQFDYVINFDGYSPYWTAIFSGFGCKNILVQHSSMYEEYVSRFPDLIKVFNQYQYYCCVTFVSKQTMALNTNNFKKYLGISCDNFTYLDNLINYKEILQKSKEEVIDFKFDKTKKYFVNIGRLSVEKDQTKLINAFAKVYEHNKNIVLLIIGQGPLEKDLRDLIKKLSLDNVVFLLGQKRNPYSYLNKCDCFVSSSNHEGQPMVLFEALVLGKGIIYTDIIGNNAVMNNRGGVKVDNSVDGIYNGIKNFLSENIEFQEFDYKLYNKNATKHFYNILENN